jgi:hypothetical protein
LGCLWFWEQLRHQTSWSMIFSQRQHLRTGEGCLFEVEKNELVLRKNRNMATEFEQLPMKRPSYHISDPPYNLGTKKLKLTTSVVEEEVQQKTVVSNELEFPHRSQVKNWIVVAVLALNTSLSLSF